MPIATLLLSLALQAAPPATPAPQPAATPAATPFRSEVLHLTYALPSGLHVESSLAEQALKEETDKSTGVQKLAVQCVTLPLMAMDTSATFRMVSIMRMDETCLGISTAPNQLGNLASSTLSESLKRMGGEAKVLTAVDYKVGDHSASVIRGSVASEKLGLTFQAAATCALFDKAVVCWEFIALDSAVVDQLAESLVHFDGQDPLPVVPADIIAKTK